ncbi:hypothetical protein D0Z00_000746 [Geotrichum galactomycetum]|uniref:Uncharacterized protein n=1 Tax=Geotrichum galactomycetum TaxID=27317 RepID=A0ACB6V926_9ASCO|nr:hypothetical protein D0Z00_000746 [Geotrichum candidum]
MEIGRPNQKNQPSRKGKKAWRKNIDIDDIQESFDTIREVEREHGVRDMATLKSDQLFQVDTAGDDALKSKRERKVKPLKADEILSRRSAVPALTQGHAKSEKNKRREGLSAGQVKKLLDRAGKSTVTKMRSNRVEAMGLTKAPTYDIWGDDDSASVDNSNSFIAHLKQATSYNKATTVPSSIGKNSMSLAPNRKVMKPVEVPNEGKSYNPTIESWQALIKEEHEKEAKREEERLALEEKQNRIQLIISNYDDNGELSESDDEDEEEEEEATKQDNNDDDLEKLSVNKPVENKKKLRKQRNKEKRHAERVKLESELKALKKQIRDLENIPKLLAEAEKQVQAAIAANTAAAAGGNKKRKAPKLSKNHQLAELPLEVKLSDELTDSLRLLRPEGNLAKERFRSLQERGLIEPRVPVQKKRKYAPKITEKWSFKDIKL